MKSEKKPSWKRKLLIAVCCVLSAVLLLLLAGMLFLGDILSDIGRLEDSQPTLSPEEIQEILQQTDPKDPSFTGPVLDEDEVHMPTGPADDLISGENLINFLLVGQDRRPGNPRMHSDAMILVTINKNKKTLTMTSFMRDLWVEIPGYYNERLNVPYMLNGFDLLNKTLKYNFGVAGEHNVEVDFSGFQAAIEAADGVTIELTAAEARHLNRQNTGWSLQEGSNHLNGEQALAYSRIRAIGDDFGRTSRQRTVLMALIEKAKGMSLMELYNLVRGIIPMLTTDMTDAEILGYVVELAPLLPKLTIVSQRIPADNAYYDAEIRGNLVLCMDKDDWATNLKILEESLAE